MVRASAANRRLGQINGGAENDDGQLERIDAELDEEWDLKKVRARFAEKHDSRSNSKQDPERKLLERARMVAVQAELLATHKKDIHEVSIDTAPTARKDIAEAIRYLQDLEELLLGKTT
jgi:hypothetical protein